MPPPLVRKSSDAASAGRVLVVDDVEANRELLSQELEDEGFEIMTASDGATCLSLAASWNPEVILLDIQMPGMNGIEVCRRLKELQETASIPVLFLTAKRTDEESVVEALRAGGNDFLSKPYSPAILIARVSSQVSISRAHAQLRRLAMVDELTGVYSRRHLFSSLHQIIRGGARSGPNSMGCLMIDVDHFKRVNDELGHLEGDRVLREVARTIVEATRETDIVARFGGEEFVALLPATDLPGALVVAENVRAKVAKVCAPVTVSVGVSSRDFKLYSPGDPPPQPEETIRKLLQETDDAVYQAKREGRNRVVSSKGDS